MVTEHAYDGDWLVLTRQQFGRRPPSACGISARGAGGERGLSQQWVGGLSPCSLAAHEVVDKRLWILDLATGGVDGDVQQAALELER